MNSESREVNHDQKLLKNLQAQVRSLKSWIVATAVMASGSVLLAFGSLVWAGLPRDSLRLVDGQWITRVQLSVSPDGGTRVDLNDTDGSSRVVIGANPKGAVSMSVIGRDGLGEATLLVWGDASPGLYMYDSTHTKRAELLVAEDGAPRIVFFDEAGNTIWSAP